MSVSIGGQGRSADEESPQPLGDRLLGPIQSGQEHAAAAVQQVAHDLSGLQLQRQRRFDQRPGDFEQLAGQRRQLIDGQTAVARHPSPQPAQS